MARTPKATTSAADVSTAPYNPDTDPRIAAKRSAQAATVEILQAPAPVEAPSSDSESEAAK